MNPPADPPPNRAPPRALPSAMVRAAVQVDVLGCACAQPGPFAAQDLSASIGITAARITHALRLARQTGLIEGAPGRLHRATAAGRKVGQSWGHGTEEGHAALREAWQGTWFVQCVRHQLRIGPATVPNLAAHLVAQVDAGVRERLEVEVLVDILIHIGLLQTSEPGLLALRPPLPITTARRGHEARQPVAPLPSPRRFQPDWAEVEELLANPIHAADLIRLTPTDLEHVQEHLKRLATIIIPARHRRPIAKTAR